MTNNEAVNWIINIAADIGKIEHQDLWHYEQALSEIREMLETAQPEPQWIPCSERLPDKEGDYLATCCVCGYVYVGISRYLICDDGDIFWELQNVLAWMPLPELYKGEQK